MCAIDHIICVLFLAQELEQQVKLSKNMQRKLRRLQEEEEKKKFRVQVMETLQYPVFFSVLCECCVFYVKTL